MDLFLRMAKGEFENGQKTLRAKIDMASGNLNMRDPVIYRIMKVPHIRTGDKWCVYPMLRLQSSDIRCRRRRDPFPLLARI